ncbi:ATP-dependent DNA helicase UvrD/PcrA [Candidatus Phytoplasma rubi]|uniref:DNA 3'-5' helicase n=1 Tax=Candidatus Phytoplasma rubi TaxID=399025 RepID=A0ABY7BR81_9MOLU|nr:ATP-dependent helicase [Candidatus Phytoplasma rubi]WAN63223.1 ATP-dependent DNA helicase UvrD/PcrA [Candidatus Phytoplasma rubi]
MEKQKWLNNLNEKQIKVINSDKKAIYLHAGAGTGKTTTLTNKIVNLINDLNIDGDNILAITFTNNAAKEMRQRLKEFIPFHDFSRLTICTFHSFGYSFLKQNITYLNSNLTSSFFIIDEKESKKIIKEKIDILKLDKDRYKVKDLITKISYIKNNKIKKQIFEELKIQKQINIGFNSSEEKKIFNLYEEYLKQNNFLDFDDLIIYTYKILKNNNSLTSFYQKKFSHILIDEFQDIDLIQYQIIKMISKNNFIFAVGDPNQNIYSFRGSDSFCNKLFIEDFKGNIFYLDQNYRSSQKILDKANLLIKYNYDEKQNYFKNNLKSNITNGEIIYRKFQNDKKEAEFIAKKIKKLVQNSKYNYKDIAILYRINKLYKEIENNLIIQHIPYVIKNSVSFYQKKEIKDFLAYLKVLLFPKNDFDFKRIINTPPRQIGKTTINKLEKIANERKISLFEAMDYASEQDTINLKINNLKKTFQELLKIFHDESKCNLSNCINLINEKIKYSEILDQKEKDKNNYNKKKENKIKDNLNNLQEIFNLENKKQKGNFLEKLNELLNKITLYSEKDDNDKNQVLLSSIHKVKGLEFKIVFIIGLEDNIFADDIEKYGKENVQEDRRIAYVAITRAKELLFLTSANFRKFLFRNKQNECTRPVSFLEEMKFPKTKENIIISEPNKYKSIDITKDENKTSYKAGDKVMHNIFGKGFIISVNKDILSIIFSKPHGIKKILITHNSFKKI